jgi:glycosyltransferase involved in cell wall biosynthesis
LQKNGQIRVLQFLNEGVRAGAEEVAFELFRRLDPTRFRSYLVAPPALLKTFDGEWKGENTTTLSMKLDNPWQWPEAREFVAYLKAEQIDVVHAHMIRAGLATVPLARLAGVPVVLHTCHGREAWRKTWIKRQYWIDRRIADWSDATIAVSESTANYLIADKRFDPQKVKLIRNGRTMNGFNPSVETNDRLRREFGFAPDSPIVGVFGRLEPQKAHEYFVAALPAVLARVPDLKVLFAGDGSLRAALEEQVKTLGLQDTVIFAGYRNDCMELMSMCELVVLPSLYEGMPLVPIEAAALAKAVVATSVDGTREVVVDGVTGLLVPPREPQPLAQAVLRLLLDRAERLQMGEKARVRAREHFSLDHQVEVTAAFYEELLGARVSKRIQ